MTQWTITVDHIAEPRAEPGTNYNAVGVVGPRQATLSAEEIAKHPQARAFRMYDDDGELYYEGFVVGNDYRTPLYHFGMPNAGCVRIHILEDGKWVTV